MNADLTLAELLEACPHHALVGSQVGVLEQRIGAFLAVPEAGLPDLGEATLEVLLAVIRSGRCVLVLTIDAAEGQRIRALLGIRTAVTWGRA